MSFVTFVYWSGEIARELATALSDAAERGVTVRVLVDGFGSKSMPRDLMRQMESAGCRVAVFHPIRWSTLHRSNFRTHRKILVVDGVVGFTGGVGIAKEWQGDARDPTQWRDTHFELKGPVVRYLHSGFDENWRVATGELVAWTEEPSERPVGDDRAVPVLGRPGIGASKMALSLWMMCQVAERRLWIQTPYFVPSEDLRRALCTARERGVDVRLMVPGMHYDRRIVQLQSRRFFAGLLEHDVEVLEYNRTMLHCKIVIVDEDLCLIGSSNLDHRSFELNYEMLIALESARRGGPGVRLRRRR